MRDVSLESPGRPGAFFILSLCIGRHRTRRQATALVSWPSRARQDRVVTSPGPSFCLAAGRGAWMIPLLGQWALQLVENQLAMLLEYAQRRFERMEDAQHHGRERLDNPNPAEELQVDGILRRDEQDEGERAEFHDQ